MYELNPIGQIYLTGFRMRNPKPVNLVDAGDKRKEPAFREDHYPIDFKKFVKKVWEQTPWIVTTNSMPYDGQKAIKGIGFFVRKEEGKQTLFGTYQDKDKFGARFRIRLTDESATALTWAADQLNRKYR
jgi:hypothetical protein